MADAAESLVLAFNEAINARDIDQLISLMTDDHRFIDSAGAVVAGKPACAEAWRGFFAAFLTTATSSRRSATYGQGWWRSSAAPSVQNRSSRAWPGGG